MDFNPSNQLNVGHSSIPSPHENPTNPPQPPPLVLPSATGDSAPPVTLDQTYDEDLEYFRSLPPGFRFCPYDEELILCYLLRKIKNEPLPRNMIKEVQLYDLHPDILVEKYRHFGEKDWYFFTPRNKKYKNGDRPKRATDDGIGYWKATGADKEIEYQGKTVGLKKALVYYEGKPPNGIKTNWIMHEYREDDRNRQRNRPNNGMLLDPCVLCRVHKKSLKSKSPTVAEADNDDETISDGMAANLIFDAEQENFANDIIVDPEEEQNGTDDYLPYSGAYELPPLPESIYVSSDYQPTRFFHQQFSQPVYTPPIRRVGQSSGNVPPPNFSNGQMMVHGSFTNMAPGFNPTLSHLPYPGSMNGPSPHPHPHPHAPYPGSMNGPPPHTASIIGPGPGDGCW